MVPHIVSRELIALSGGRAGENGRPVLGMFLGGAGLADTILYCRHKIYPLGLPNRLAHFVTFVMGRRPDRPGAAGARHVPRRRRARRHDPLLPPQNLPARPAQLAPPFRYLPDG